MKLLKKFRILIIDDDSSVRSVLKSRFERHGHEVSLCASGDEALQVAKEFNPHVAISDIKMPGTADGFLVIEKLSVPTILITGHGDKESAIKAVEVGAFAFFEKPFDMDALEVSVIRGAERHVLDEDRKLLLKRLERLVRLQDRELEHQREKSKFLGSSAKILEVKNILSRLALKPHATVLLLGETGTGKEVAARELHELTYNEKSSHIPFLALNCAAIPQEILESELFGHEKGAFTGAQSARLGLAEAVREGTLFLDEIGEMDLKLQAKLLRLLEAKTFRRVGSNHELHFKGRIVAATHRDLKRLISEGQFREDLYYRLSVVQVTLPPLRERGKDDLKLLALGLCARHGVSGISKHRLSEILEYSWPGNIRELNNWIERGAILGELSTEGEIISPLPQKSTGANVFALNANENNIVSADILDIKHLRKELLDQADKTWIKKALLQNQGNIAATARQLGLDRKNLSIRMKELGLNVTSVTKRKVA